MVSSKTNLQKNRKKEKLNERKDEKRITPVLYFLGLKIEHTIFSSVSDSF